MTNKNFYAFCRDQRKVETDLWKQNALNEVYHHMRECGVTKSGVKQFIEHKRADGFWARFAFVCSLPNEYQAAYTWLEEVYAR